MADADTPSNEPMAAKSGRKVSFFLLTTVGVMVSLLFVHVLLFPIAGAVTLAVVLDGPRAWLRGKLGGTAAAAVLLFALCVAVLLPLFFLVRSVTGEVFATVQYVQSGAADQELHQLTAKHAKVGHLIQKTADQLTPGEAGRQVAGKLAMWIGQGLRSFAGGVTELALLLFFLFFLLRDRDSAYGAFAALIPLPQDDTRHILTRLGELIYAVFAGRFVIATVQGALAGLAYWLLGVPGALLWTLLTALCCLVPAFGAFLAWIPIALYLGLADSWTKALIMAAWGGIVVSNIDNVLYPVLVGRRTSLHTAVIFVAIFGGVAVFGISGFVLGPVVVAATMLLLGIWKKQLGTDPGAVESGSV